MAAEHFVGTWKIVECVNLSGASDATSIEGTEFHLEENGDVTWKVVEGAESIPLFACETYEVYASSSSGTLTVRFGAFDGHVIEFRADRPCPREPLLLTYEGWCMLQCQPLSLPEPPQDFPYSLLPALHNAFFADLVLQAENGVQVQVHSTVLSLSASDLDWSGRTQPVPLCGLPEDVLRTLLHFLYAECLPPDLSESTAHRCLQAAKAHPIPPMARFAAMCQLYLNNTALKHQIISLVSDMHTCAQRIVEYFSGKASPGVGGGGGVGSSSPSPSPASPSPPLSSTPPSHHPHHPHSDPLAYDPPRLCFVVKQSLREAAIAIAKLLLLCDLFGKRKGELTREERHEIVRYARSRLPVFVSQLIRFLRGLQATLGSMAPPQRHKVAAHLVPEIEIALDYLSGLTEEAKVVLEHIITVSTTERHQHQQQGPERGNSGTNSKTRKGPRVGEILGRSLRNALHLRELTKLRNLNEKMTMSFMFLMQKKENFRDMTSANKIRSVARNLELLMEELPVFLLRLEEVMLALDDKFQWREFKFCFKVGTSKVAGVLGKLAAHRGSLQAVLGQLSEAVQRDAFTQSLQALGLLVEPSSSSSSSCSSTSSTSSAAANPSSQTGSPSPSTAHNYNHRNQEFTTTHHTSFVHGPTKHHGYKLNLVESLCEPPKSGSSNLAQAALQLLRSGKGTDMVFEVVGGGPECGGEAVPEPCCMRAHRVVVAARCDWFRRALLSGMREAIDKKIVIHDTSASIFALFLEYLYGGQLGALGSLSPEQLADLLLLGDRYELDCLKQACEQALRSHVDEDSALYLLGLADRYNATALKKWCVEFVCSHSELLGSELFEELPTELQEEVCNHSGWSTGGAKLLLGSGHRTKMATSHHRLSGVETEDLMLGGGPPLLGRVGDGDRGGEGGGDDSPASAGSSSSVADLDEMTSRLCISSREAEEASDSSSLEEMLLTQDSARLESCVGQLRDVLGEAASREELVRVALAADYDVNRAVNFFLS